MNRQGEGNEREKGCVCDLAPRGTLFPNLRVLCYLSHLHSATSAHVTFLPALQCLFTPRLAPPRCSCTRAHDIGHLAHCLCSVSLCPVRPPCTLSVLCCAVPCAVSDSSPVGYCPHVSTVLQSPTECAMQGSLALVVRSSDRCPCAHPCHSSLSSSPLFSVLVFAVFACR